MKTIGIIGTRRRDSCEDFKIVCKKFLEVYIIGDQICSGLCSKGGDRFAIIIAKKYKCQTLWFLADWNRYGREAGFIRNTDIAKNSNILIACVSANRTGGTEDTIRKFIKFHGAENLNVV